MDKLDINGDDPLQRFGHTMTMISKTKAILFGGAVSSETNFRITSDTYLFDCNTQSWKKLNPVSQDQKEPCARAAHSATSVEEMQLVIYGGAVGHGVLAKDDLFLLKSIENEHGGSWVKVPVEGARPGIRYGHCMAYFKPYIVIFGGNTGKEALNDVWVLNVDQIPFKWEKVECKSIKPMARVYHSSCIWKPSQKTEMLLVFGGRSGTNRPLNDLWGLRRHSTGEWDWQEAPYRQSCTKPDARYQHSSLCCNNFFIVVGGRNNVENQILNLEVFNLDNSEWYRLTEINRFRHTSWISNNKLYIHGGFEPRKPSVPTGDLFEVDLRSQLSLVPNLSNDLNLGEEISPMQTGEPQNPYKLSYQAVIANVPYGDEQSFIQKKPITKLERESMRITEVNQNISNQTSVYHDSLYSVILKQLLKPKTWKPPADGLFPIQKSIILKLCDEVIKILKTTPTVLDISPPAKIFGSIYGQYGDLMRFFNVYGVPDDSEDFVCDMEGLDYLFLGNYVDRGKHSLEVLCLLFALKIKFPTQIHLLRGGHEDSRINSIYGFADECQQRFKENPLDENSVYKKINQVFEYLPLAAIIAGKIFCVHSGIGTNIKTIDDIRKIKRPMQVNYDGSTLESKIVLDLLWSDPVQSTQERATVVILILLTPLYISMSTKAKTSSPPASSSATEWTESTLSSETTTSTSSSVPGSALCRASRSSETPICSLCSAAPTTGASTRTRGPSSQSIKNGLRSTPSGSILMEVLSGSSCRWAPRDSLCHLEGIKI